MSTIQQSSLPQTVSPVDITSTGPDQPTVTLAPPSPPSGDDLILSEELQQAHSEGEHGPATGAHQDQLIQNIGSMSDPIKRNEAITASYHDIGLQMHDMLGPESGVNWSSWAAQASNTVGHNMRGDPTGGLASSPAGQVAKHLPGLGVTDNQKLFLGKGNQLVYTDVAPRMESFIKTFKGDTRVDLKKYEDWSNKNLLERDNKTGKMAVDPHMHDGFLAYYRAKFDTNAHQRDEEMVLGNANIGWHEQDLLQDDLGKAINGGNFDNRQKTDEMAIKLPGETLQLASDVPSYHGQEYPTTLQHMDGPLKAFVDQNTYHPGTLKGSRAGDWSIFKDRMNFITNMFASRQDDMAVVDQLPDLVG